MGLFLTLYGALSAGFLAGAAVYLWRWKQPPEVRYVKEGQEIVRRIECRHYGYAEEDGVAKMRCLHHDRETMPHAFCSAGERPTPYVAPKNYSAYADAYRDYCRMNEYNTIKNWRQQHE